MGAARAAAYRAAFGEVAVALRTARLRVDEHGATPSTAEFARTRTQWRRAAQEWLRSPLDKQGMLMASLMIDGRPIQGDPAATVIRDVVADVRDHPGTMRLLVRESRRQLAQLERGEDATDVVWMRRLPPLDRSIVAQSVREISTVQKRLFSILQYTSPEEWGRGPHHGDHRLR